jgi:hypothetical protein
VPEQQDQDDDRDGHSDQPEQDAATHGSLLSADIPWMYIADRQIWFPGGSGQGAPKQPIRTIALRSGSNRGGLLGREGTSSADRSPRVRRAAGAGADVRALIECVEVTTDGMSLEHRGSSYVFDRLRS